MKLKLIIFLLALTVLPVRTPAPIYMKIEGIDGEVLDQLHPASIDIESFSWGMTQSTTTSTGGAGAGKVSFQDIHFTKVVDKSSPLLMMKCANGQHIPRVQLFLRKAGAEKPLEYYQITLEDCLISSFNVGGSSGGDRPTESLSLNFTKIIVSYQVQKADGTLDQPIIFSWNKATNTP
jgi:type VI secretion system secreted protein Hcp